MEEEEADIVGDTIESEALDVFELVRLTLLPESCALEDELMCVSEKELLEMGRELEGMVELIELMLLLEEVVAEELLEDFDEDGEVVRTALVDGLDETELRLVLSDVEEYVVVEAKFVLIYTSSRQAPPQYSEALPLQTISQPVVFLSLPGTIAPPFIMVFPQKHCY